MSTLLENRTIWTGDNLDVMRGIESESVDLIYLDPPFNSNHDYAAPIGSKAAGAAFKDTWTLADIDETWIGLLAESYPALHSIINSAGVINGNSDKAYLTYIAMRMLEMYRILKPTGSIYLHCDSLMSHGIKLMMDAIFGGRKRFVNEIVWKRVTSTQKGSQYAARQWGNTSAHIFFYTRSNDYYISPYKELIKEEIYKKFKLVDKKGDRYYDDSAHIWRTPKMGARPNLCYEWHGFKNPHPSGWRLSKERLEQEYKKGNIVIRQDGKLERRKYYKDYKGYTFGNIWSDIPPVGGKENIGYPTQKPLKLLRRIIKASSKEGDVVLDPFCGCATTCLAAEELNRQWIGIDISPLAAKLVVERFGKELGLFGLNIDHKTTLPKPIEKLSKNIKHVLFYKQGEKCAGCKKQYIIQMFELDHIIPKAKGGVDIDSNLQLLCSWCNRIKGDRTMDYLIEQLKSYGMV